jgi:hypothetical protein
LVETKPIVRPTSQEIEEHTVGLFEEEENINNCAKASKENIKEDIKEDFNNLLINFNNLDLNVAQDRPIENRSINQI